jgi:hypothetical protein
VPKIQWTGLPPALRDHLFERLRERRISADDLYQLKLWRESGPDAPEGAWYKDFGSFKISGAVIWQRGYLDKALARVRTRSEAWASSRALLVVGPQPKNLDHALFLQHLIDEAMLDVDAS